MAQDDSILADLFKRQAPGPIQPIKRLRIKRLLTEPLVVVPGGHVVRSEAYARELVGLTATVFFSPALNKLRQRPEITEARIATDLTGRQVSVDPPSISWRFDTRVTTEITIVQSNYSGDNSIILIDAKSEAGPRAFFTRKMAGKLRLHYEWALGWTLGRIENLDFKEQ
jgi:hypothetical protein